jgi:hypothetical protein
VALHGAIAKKKKKSFMSLQSVAESAALNSIFDTFTFNHYRGYGEDM